VRGRALERVVRIARAKLHRLVGRLVDGACPSSWWERLADRIEQTMSLPASRLVSVAVAASLAALAVVAVGVALEVVQPIEAPQATHWSNAVPADRGGRLPAVVVPAPATSRVPATAPASSPIDAVPAAGPAQLPYANLSGYAGATVDVPDAQVVPWGLTYDGPGDVLFRALTLDRYDPEVGWLRRESMELADYPDYRCRRRCITVRLEVVAPSEPLVVPMPTGTRLERETLRFGGDSVETVYENEHGEALVLLDAGRVDVLEYVVGPGRPGRRPTVGAPEVAMPAWIERKLAQVGGIKSESRRVRQVTHFVRDQLEYDVSPEAAHAFATEPGDWLSRVLSLKAGDCDVKNGVNVLLLRRVGIPARMAVGIAARGGRARPNLHAWTEYYVKGKGWRAIDATGISTPRPAVASTAPASLDVEPARERPAAVLADPAGVRQTSAGPGVTTDVVPQVKAPVASGPTESPAVSSPVPKRAGRMPLAAVALLIGLAGSAWFLLRRRVQENVVSAGDAVEQQRVLATMLRDALAHPDAWRSVASLWRRRVLPTLRGRKMSVAEALSRAIDGVLFVSRDRSDLARLAAARRTPVLDGADPVFGGVVGALGRTVDLDALSALRPPAGGCEDVTGYRLEGVLAPVNRILRQVTSGVECRVCPALTDASIRDVDLTAINLPRRSPWPQRFVAVNPCDPEVRRRARLLAQDPGRGVFVWIDWLLDRSQILSRDATRLRERAAAELLEVVA
jgi:transglutaminase-like putative cysteine protease